MSTSLARTSVPLRRRISSQTATESDGSALRGTSVGSNIDDRRPDDQLQVSLFNRPLTIGGEYGVTPEHEHDFEFDEDQDDDSTFVELSWAIEFLYEWSPNVTFFFDTAIFYAPEVRDEGGSLSSDSGLERGQAWVLIEELFGSNFSLQIGSHYFSEDREWFWDELLDGISLQYETDDFFVDLGIAQALARESTDDDGIDPEDKDVRRLIATVQWDWARRQYLDFFFLSQQDNSRTHQPGELIDEDDEDEVDGDVWWFGTRMTGRLKFDRVGRFYYWWDTAIVRGDEVVIDFDDADDRPGIREVDEIFEHPVEGWATDFGVTWESRLPWRPSVTLGYAYGSGEPTDNRREDTSFRQTGLEGNNDRFRGVNRFRFYGELLDPELSNLRISTISIGFPLFEESSVELLYHRYNQVHATPFLRNAKIDQSPEGEHRDVGQEIDLVLGIEEWKHVELEIIAAMFRAGKAYDEFAGERAASFVFKFNYNY